MAKLPRKPPVPKPHIRMRKLSTLGRSAFPPAAKTAFDPGGGPASPDTAFGPPITGAAAPGDGGG